MSRERIVINPLTALIIVVSLFVVGGLIKNAISIYRSRSRLEMAEQQIASLEAKKVNLEKELTNQTDPAALDQAIRNKLNLTKPGETLIVITGTPAASVAATPSPKPTATSTLKEWWNILNPKK